LAVPLIIRSIGVFRAVKQHLELPQRHRQTSAYYNLVYLPITIRQPTNQIAHLHSATTSSPIS